MRSRNAWLVVVAALALIAGACGDDDDDTAADDTVPEEAVETTTTAPPSDEELDGGGDGELDGGAVDETTVPAEDDPCAGVTLEATETGITEDTITVLVMADVGSELAPGLFQGSIDGTKAWAEKVNATGGLACRQVEVLEWDSAINPTETTNGFLEGCDNAFAMVGSNALFVLDVAALDSCPDAAGNPTGIPDLPALAVANAHQCSPNVFPGGPRAGHCPYSGSGPRDYTSLVGPHQWVLDNVLGGGPIGGLYLVPSDLPTTIESSMPLVVALNDIGIDSTGGEFGVSGSDEQATYGQYVQFLADTGATWAYGGSNDQAMLKLRRESAAQGLDQSTITWVCSLACYTPDFTEQGGAEAEGTYVNMQFLPFGEADSNEELATFLEYMGDPFPPSWAANAWVAGLLFEEAVNAIVAESGPNGLTRASLLAQLATVESFDANGWYGTLDFTAEASISSCYVLLQVQDGEYVRVHPEEPGTFDCEEGNLVRIDQLDSAARFGG